ncbi:zinc finger BED domain-containing protein DAYSLEEPER-like [Melia azedarach]|uniref:Zinc finger BED domain-containing protein DAYSLEEPER-like n=1 Tax=Melia azedarach TaxID=155640 RepID=A0ACC1XFH8_MELAZ|nr:zinc finger BED domain-containing protein DAYSLEEPER-like [Melia azedarach]
MATTAETQPDNNVITTPESQPKDAVMGHEAEPGDAVLTHEAKPSSTMNSEGQPNDVTMNPEAQPHIEKDQPSDATMNPQDQPNNVTMNPETQQPNNVTNPETQPQDTVMNSETQPQDTVMNCETQPQDMVMSSETLPQDMAMTSETHPNDAAMNSETQPNDEVMNPETQPNDAVMNPETQPNDTAMNPETQPKDAAMNPGTLPQDAMVNPKTHADNTETQPQDVVMNQETQPQDAVMNHETMPQDAVMNPETQPQNEMMNPETQLQNEMMNPEIQPQNEMMNPEAEPHHEMMNPEAEPHHELINHEMHPFHEMMSTEMQHHHEMMNAEMRHHHEMMNPETQPHHQMMNPETQPHHEIMNPEAQPHHEMMNPEAQPHHQMMNSETQLHHEMMNSETQALHAIMSSETQPHDAMMNPETQPNDVMMTPEKHLNNELTVAEQPGNALATPEAQHNNALTIPEEHNNALAIVNTQPNNEVTSPETQPNKRRKKKSIVWEHFTIETVSAGCRRACCKQCKQSFAYSTGSKVAGTSHLKRHIAKGTCPALLRNQDNNNQLTPYNPRIGGSEPPKRRYRSPSLPYISFDQDRCRHEIARMIIMHDYPLHMVEHPGFITFVQNLQPRFDKVSFNTVQGDCVATYLREKQSLMKFIEGIPGRLCLTLDMWTSSQTLGYVFITGHFIDSDWKLQRRILNVVMEPYPESDTAFSHAVAACISDWSLEGRVFSLTFNHPLSETGLDYLRPLLCIKNPLILNGQLLVGNCIAHTLSSMAKDVLAAGQEIIKKIRDSVKYVKTSESHEEKFLELKQQLQVPSEKSLSLDDQTKWNTTHQMLVAASELKEVFSCLDTSDPDYKEAPSMEDWKVVETLCAVLKPLYDAANMLTTTTNPTAITFFHEAWKILSDLTRAVTNEDSFVNSFTQAMLEKIDKYWKDCCLVLAIAVVMDPRFKMKLVEFSFTKVFGEDALAYIKIVDDGIHELFLEYVSLPLPLTPTYAEEGNAGNNTRTDESQGGTLLSDNGLTDFDMYIMETTSQQMKSELDQYLDESLLPRSHDFDLLGWWKLNKMKYPTLSKMARDVLSVPVCSVGRESVFDTVSKEMDPYRSSLRPETVEALICAKDWFQYGSSEASNAIVKMEF